MSNVSNLPGSKRVHVVILGKPDKKVVELEKLLAGYVHKVHMVSDPAHADAVQQHDHVRVIIATDSLEQELNKDFFSDLRWRFPQAKVLCLADDITPETETPLRSCGLVFLGSYEHFCTYHREIIESIAGSSGSSPFMDT